MDKLGPRLKQYRLNKRLTQQEVADYCGGLKKAAVSAWESEKARPTIDAIMKLKDLYHVTLDELLLGNKVHSGSGEHAVTRVPLIDWADVANFTEELSVLEGFNGSFVPCAVPHSSQSYALTVKGESMTAPTGRSYPSGRVIICDPLLADDVETGQRVIARLHNSNSITFKELVNEDGRRWLRSLNPEPHYAPITEEFTVLAVVIASHIPE